MGGGGRYGFNPLTIGARVTCTDPFPNRSLLCSCSVTEAGLKGGSQERKVLFTNALQRNVSRVWLDLQPV